MQSAQLASPGTKVRAHRFFRRAFRCASVEIRKWGFPIS
jgi:hypothetical protein